MHIISSNRKMSDSDQIYFQRFNFLGYRGLKGVNMDLF